MRHSTGLLCLLCAGNAAFAAPSSPLLPPQADARVFRLPEQGIEYLILDEPPTALERDLWLEELAGLHAPGSTRLRLAVRSSGGLVWDQEPSTDRVPEKEPWAPSISIQPHRRLAGPPNGRVRVPSAPPIAGTADHPGTSIGSLSGKAIYVSQCHGWVWYDTLGEFSTQRGNNYDTVEDFHNPEGADQFLIRYLENAGASVFTARERDQNPEMAIADNDGLGYSEGGEGIIDGAAGFGDGSPWSYGENPFETGTTRRLPGASNAVATWTPEVPTDGSYAVYVSWDSAPDNSPNAHYRVHHPGGIIEHVYDQRVHGSTWQYLDTLWLTAGTDSLRIELLAEDSPEGTWLSADAVRIGGGMTDVQRHGTDPGRPRWEDGAVQFTQWQGAPTSVYDPYGDDNGSDPPARSRWADWERPSGEDAVFISWHSNAGGGVGSSTYTYEGSGGIAVAGSEELGDLLQEEMIDAFRELYDSSWSDRGHLTANFAEVNPSHNDETPAALVELAFHDSVVDVEYLKNPAFRQDASRAMLRGLIRYFAERDGITPVYPPEAPISARLVHREDGELVLSWADGQVGAPYGDAPNAWKVYTSLDGRSWDNGVELTEREAILDIGVQDSIFVRVSATNAGGESFPSEIMGTRKILTESPPVLVVSAFDRIQTAQLDWEYDVPNLGDLRRLDMARLNPANTVAQHGRAIANAGWYFDSASDESLGDLDLSRYEIIIWAAGEESTTDEAISDAQQGTLRSWVADGGKLIVSGSEVLWDLDYLGTATDQAFVEEVLGVRLESDDSESYLVSGEGPLSGWSGDFSPAASGCYPNEWPDVYTSERTVVARYATGGIAGVSDGQVAAFGFPLECAGTETDRTSLFASLLPTLSPDWVDPGPGEPDDGGEDGGSDGASGDDGTDGGRAPDSTPTGQDRPGASVSLTKPSGCAHSSARLAWSVAALAAGLLAIRRKRT
jgi:hypothetical protein